ncbi:hypothetical protein Tsubulata_045528 [Turnera subulata]|uniref:Uncharacterized protein n=1 Tax=Turnera subulata TaxID=218843 RepID=A0A9Q0G8L6_9ROSI|nr:hypothetical protein Tsubulata_045528 [Turnera subulata]
MGDSGTGNRGGGGTGNSGGRSVMAMGTGSGDDDGFSSGDDEGDGDDDDDEDDQMSPHPLQACTQDGSSFSTLMLLAFSSVQPLLSFGYAFGRG